MCILNVMKTLIGVVLASVIACLGVFATALYEDGNRPALPKPSTIVTEAPSTPAPTQLQTTKPTQPKKVTTQSKPATTPSSTPVNTQTLPTLDEASIFSAVNAYRSASGKPPFNLSQELCAVAESRADFMMRDGMAAFKNSKTDAHVGYDDVFIPNNNMGENLAANVRSTNETMTVWKNSGPHNALLLITEVSGSAITKGCVATRVATYGSIVVLEVGD